MCILKSGTKSTSVLLINGIKLVDHFVKLLKCLKSSIGTLSKVIPSRDGRISRTVPFQYLNTLDDFFPISLNKIWN